MRALVTLTCACLASCSALATSRCDSELTPRPRKSSIRLSSRSAICSRLSASILLARVISRSACARATACTYSASSRSATIWPRVTSSARSRFICSTRPATLGATTNSARASSVPVKVRSSSIGPCSITATSTGTGGFFALTATPPSIASKRPRMAQASSPPTPNTSSSRIRGRRRGAVMDVWSFRLTGCEACACRSIRSMKGLFLQPGPDHRDNGNRPENCPTHDMCVPMFSWIQRPQRSTRFAAAEGPPLASGQERGWNELQLKSERSTTPPRRSTISSHQACKG